MKNPIKQLKLQVHFIGVGGIGMSALARWFLSQGWIVSGSDIERSDITDSLAHEGVLITVGHAAKNVPKNTTLVVHTQAVRKDNPEYIEALRRKLKILSYPQVVGTLTRMYTTVAIAGSHGKSTTSALLGLILMKGKQDPTIIVGTKLRELHDGNFRFGEGEYLVLEADEYGRAFWNYSPTFLIVTNIDREHLDVYKNLRGVQNGFLRFLSGAKDDGAWVLNRDDKNLYALKIKIAVLAKKKNVKVVWYSLRQKEAKKVKKVLQLAGVHNFSNALAAYLLARLLRISEQDALRAIGAYKGAWRRMEYRGMYNGAFLYDDYGHHPSEIVATLSAFRERYPDKKILCVFQPHQADRLKRLFKEFRGAFHEADITLILPLYHVAGRDKPSPLFDSQALVRAIQKSQPKKPIFYLDKPANLKNALGALMKNPREYVVVMMGAGDIVKLTDSLV